MPVSKLPTTALRIMAAELGVVKAPVVCNRVWFSCEDYSAECQRQLSARTPTMSVGTADGTPLIYEVLQACKGSPLFLREHLERLRQSVLVSELCQRLHQPAELDDKTATRPTSSAWKEAARYCVGSAGLPALVSDIDTTVRQLVAEHSDLHENIKIFVFMAPRNHAQNEADAEEVCRWCFSFCAYFVKALYPGEEMYAQGVRLAVLHDAERHNPTAKVVQDALRDRAVAEQRRTGCFEVLLAHADGLVPEGSRSNYLLVDGDGAVHMSCDEDVLIGITRRAIEACCRDSGIPLIKRKLYLPDVLGAKAVAMTGTSVGVLPVASIDSTEFPSAAHPVLQRLRSLYDARARDALRRDAPAD